MRREEYTAFLDFLFARFPELESWLSKLPGQRHAETVDSWRETLRKCHDDDCRAAVVEMQAAEDGLPRMFSAVPARIKKLAWAHNRRQRSEARQRPAQYVDGEKVVECLQCRDLGTVEIWHPQSLARLVEEAGDATIPRIGMETPRGRDIFGRVQTMRSAACTCCVRCTCAASDDWPRQLRTFNPEKDFPLYRPGDGGRWDLHWISDPEEIEAAREFAVEASRPRVVEWQA